MVCPEPQKLSISRARKNPGTTVPACPWQGQGQTGLGDKPHCDGFPDPQPSFCNPNPPFFKKQMAFVSVGRLLPVPSLVLWVLDADVKSKYQQNDDGEWSSSPQLMDDIRCAQKLFNKPPMNISEEITASRNNCVL